ncbi:MAG: sigma-70 family RNA polymerase sigma factor [Gammaproteobacteria bacterium]|nr:sigma-70 family RNA polymerase sigma factor [Gammaproteobacteria bacterium]
MPPNEDLPSLIAAARDGCPHARSGLVARASALARRVALARGDVDIDDMVQNTVLRVMESLASLADAQAFDAWVAAVARNEARMLARGEIRWRQLRLALPQRDPESLGTGAETVPDDSPARDTGVHAAIPRLPRDQRELIRARYVRSESYREMSARLRISISAVKSRLHRARKRLEEELKTMDPNTPVRLTAADVRSLALAAGFRATVDIRHELRCILLDRQGYVVATDGQRLLMRSMPALKSLDDDVLVEPNGAEALTGSAELTVHLDEVRLALATDELAWGISQRRFPEAALVRLVPVVADAHIHD